MTNENVFTLFPILQDWLPNTSQNSCMKISYKLGYLVFLVFQPLLLSFMYWKLLSPDSAPCYAEVFAALIYMAIYATIFNVSGIQYTLSGNKNLQLFLNATDVDISRLKALFNKNISLNPQCRIIKYTVIFFSIYWSVFCVGVLISEQNEFIDLGILGLVWFIFSTIVSVLLQAWIWIFTLMQIVFLSILVTQMQAMVQVIPKWESPFAKLCLHIFEQSILLNNVFQVFMLANIINKFGDMILIIWSASQPLASCVMGNYKYMLILCFMWNIVIIESGQYLNREVSRPSSIILMPGNQ